MLEISSEANCFMPLKFFLSILQDWFVQEAVTGSVNNERLFYVAVNAYSFIKDFYIWLGITWMPNDFEMPWTFSLEWVYLLLENNFELV